MMSTIYFNQYRVKNGVEHLVCSKTIKSFDTTGESSVMSRSLVFVNELRAALRLKLITDLILDGTLNGSVSMIMDANSYEREYGHLIKDDVYVIGNEYTFRISIDPNFGLGLENQIVYAIVMYVYDIPKTEVEPMAKKFDRKDKSEITCEIKKVYGFLNRNEDKALVNVSWNGAPARIELRRCYRDRDNGELRLGQGIALSPEELSELMEINDRRKAAEVDYGSIFSKSEGIMSKRKAGYRTENGFIRLTKRNK